MSSLVRGKWIESDGTGNEITDKESSLVRGKWIERSVLILSLIGSVSSLVRGKWIESCISPLNPSLIWVFPREREVD